MEYVKQGNSGLWVSRLSYGNWISSKGGESTLANDLVRTAWESGVNFFDTAEIYDLGEGEKQLGNALRALKVERSQLVITTKLFRSATGPHQKFTMNDVGMCKKKLISSMNRSLMNLGMDYVDVVFSHRHFEDTPMQEICEAFKVILAKGQALYWGTSEWPAIRIMEAMHICDKIGCPRPIVEQCQYNMMNRENMEKEYAALFDDYGLGTTVWSPLASGILTGKYMNGVVPDKSRFANDPRLQAMIFGKYYGTAEAIAKTDGILTGLKEIAEKDLGCKLSQMALAWTIVYPNTTTALMGASSMEQLTENLKAIDIMKKMRDSPEILAKIEMILNNRPEMEKDWSMPGCPFLPHRRGGN